MRNKVSVGEYLAFLSLKYDVDPDRFLQALNLAREKQKATCGKLHIQCRSKTEDKAIFLLMKDAKVVSQFPIPRKFFLEHTNPIKVFSKAGPLRRHVVKKDDAQYSFLIRDLKAGMKKINLKARVLEIPKPILVFTRFGNYASVANASVMDETGTIKLCLWNEQINSLNVGDLIEIENAHMSFFRGEPQLRIGKNGKINVLDRMQAPRVDN